MQIKEPTQIHPCAKKNGNQYVVDVHTLNRAASTRTNSTGTCQTYSILANCGNILYYHAPSNKVEVYGLVHTIRTGARGGLGHRESVKNPSDSKSNRLHFDIFRFGF